MLLLLFVRLTPVVDVVVDVVVVVVDYDDDVVVVVVVVDVVHSVVQKKVGWLN
jgi:hypothetical protein